MRRFAMILLLKGLNLIFRHLERIVGRRKSIFTAMRIKKVWSGGSSSIFNKAFWAWIFMASAFEMSTILYVASLGREERVFASSRIWAMVIIFFPAGGSMNIMSG